MWYPLGLFGCCYGNNINNLLQLFFCVFFVGVFTGIQKYCTCTKTLVLQEEISTREERYHQAPVRTSRLHQEDRHHGDEAGPSRKGNSSTYGISQMGH